MCTIRKRFQLVGQSFFVHGRRRRRRPSQKPTEGKAGARPSSGPVLDQPCTVRTAVIPCWIGLTRLVEFFTSFPTLDYPRSFVHCHKRKHRYIDLPMNITTFVFYLFILPPQEGSFLLYNSC
jgi:hypothetical protein